METQDHNDAKAIDKSDKPVLLKAVELVLADPSEIKKEAEQLFKNHCEKYSDEKSEDEIRELVVEKIISNYSYYAAFVGGGTGLVSVVPGLGTVIGAFGGATADMALTAKFQIEMVMAIATVYGHDITTEEKERLCFIIAGLGTLGEATKEGGKALGSKAFIKMTEKYLKGATLKTVKEIFKRVGITFTKTATKKAIPYGVSVVIGFNVNKGLT